MSRIPAAFADPPREFAFSARDRIDETEQRIRSVHDRRFHYIRTLSTGPTYASLNRYKEKCFPILPLTRQLLAEGKLTGPPLELMQRTGPGEELYDLSADPHEIHNLANSAQPEHREHCVAHVELREHDRVDRVLLAARVDEDGRVLPPAHERLDDPVGTHEPLPRRGNPRASP